MLPDIGGAELLVIAAVALIVVGPKDLPVLLRKLGQFVGKIRGMANEFRASFDEMARQSELDDLRREVEAMRAGQYANPVQSAVDEAKDAGVDQVFADIDASLNSGSVQAHPYAAHNPEPVGEPQTDAAATLEPPVKPARKRAPKAVAEPTVEIVAKKPRAKASSKDVGVAAKPKAAKASKAEVAAPAAKPVRKRTTKTAASSSDIVS
ncbi:Sec-independent protein translocase protein TatB [Caulobacter endophyticus]|uniref:Sec-independent protein translocase protein TatB n=1 Tax=Caulobacter endophyticus TaxID=2172652 RepID=UPI00240F41EB|nr:Sec-independent protein translocase protein TatB [Caulobacter endophyticus]MDG2529753.1 Sec-independent protein translocase protein TatB [Caulobacter endophyticus]